MSITFKLSQLFEHPERKAQKEREEREEREERKKLELDELKRKQKALHEEREQFIKNMMSQDPDVREQAFRNLLLQLDSIQFDLKQLNFSLANICSCNCNCSKY